MHRRRLLVSGGAMALSSLRFHRVSAQVSSPTPLQSLDEVLQEGLDRGLVGLAVQVTRGGDVVYEAAAGLASREDETPLALSDQFRIYSITKTFTALLVLDLVDAGLITLDQPITAWLDDPAVKRIPFIEHITPRQLLTHTSGIYDYFAEDSPFWQDAYQGEDADWGRIWTPDELLGYAAADRHDPAFQPGADVGYSNTGYILLGLLIEAVTGQTYAQVLQDKILDPLDLTGTVFAATEPVPNGLVQGYHLLGPDMVNVSATHLSAEGTAGGIVSTAADLTRLAQALAGGTLLTPESREAMMTVVTSERPGIAWGMGIATLQTPSGELLGMGGAGPGFTARMFFMPAQDLTFVLLSNTNRDDETLDQLLEQIVAIALAQPETAA